MWSNTIIIETGSFNISERAIDFNSYHISLDKMSVISPVGEFARHSLFWAVKTWFKIFLILIIIYMFHHELSNIYGDIYCYSIFLLLAYNVYCYFKKRFYGIDILTSGVIVCIKSNNKVFLDNLKVVLDDVINSKKANYTINIDTCNIKNNGIINKGNNNINKVKKGDKNDRK